MHQLKKAPDVWKKKKNRRTKLGCTRCVPYLSRQLQSMDTVVDVSSDPEINHRMSLVFL